MSEPQRIGVYGGTFDPIHRTHVDIARAARDFARLDRVLFIVAPEPPHKRGEVATSAEDRFAMVEIALEDEAGFEASRIEFDRSGPSYTADTLRQLEAMYPGATLYLILGFDSIIDLPGWREPEEIIARSHILVVPRPGTDAEVDTMFEGHYDLLPFEVSDVSSTEIRRHVESDASIDDWVPPGVEEFIKNRGLYHAPR